MKVRLPFIIAILLSSAGAFGLGWVLKPADPASSETASGSAVQTVNTLTPGERQRSDATLAAAKANPVLADYFKNGKIGNEEMQSAIKDMMKENDPLKRNAMFSALLEQLTPENAEAAFAALRESRGNRRGGFGRGGGGDEMRLLLNAWGRIDGENAIAKLTEIADAERAEREANGEDGRGRGRGGFDRGGTFDIYSALQGWATNDAESALAYVNSLESDGEGGDRRKGMYTGGIVNGLLANSVEDAVSFISNLPAEDGSRGRYMESVAQEVLENGAADAAKWVDSLGDDDLKSGAMNRIAESYAREDLDAAIDWISDHASEEYASRAVTEVAERWAEDDPQAVMDWASNLPQETQQGVFEEALDEWTERDPLAASEYLANMQDSPVKDSAVEGFSRELAREDAASAAAWAATIGNEELRTSTLQDVARNWVRQDRAAVEAWLPSSGLPQETQQQILEGGGRGFGGDWGGRGGGRRGR